LDLADREYWAFLSYSHVDADWAAWLLQRLETYAVPSDLVGRPTRVGPAPRRFRPVFRDREELELSSSLGERIRRALDRSKYLIVVCSPTAARSSWVNEEVAYFLSVHGGERVLCVIVDGEPLAAEEGRECFPSALIGAQPIAADLREGGDGRRLGFLKLVAGMLGVGLDALVHRDARRRQRQLAAVAALSFAGMLVMGGLAAAAFAARNEARAQKAQAEGLIEFMLVDLRKTLEPVGRLDLLEVVGQRAITYYAAQKAERLDADSLGRRSRVLHLIGEIEDQRGDLAGALNVFQKAAVDTQELLARRPDDPQRIYDHAQSAYWVGYIAWRRGQSAEATRRFREYLALSDRLVTIDPANDAWLAEVGYANSNLGTVLLEDRRASEAAAAFERSLATNLVLVRRSPADAGRLADLGQSYAWSADAQLMLGEFDRAMEHRLAERAIYSRLLSLDPADAGAVQALIVNRQGMANILTAQRKLPPAIDELRVAATEASGLLRSDRDNTQYKERLASIYMTLGQVAMATGQYEEARQAAEIAVTMAEALARQDPTVVDWVGRQLGGARLLRMRVRAQTAATELEAAEALTPAGAELKRLALMLSKKPGDLALARTASEAAILSGDYAAKMSDSDGAVEAWSSGVEILRVAESHGFVPEHDRARLLLKLLHERRQAVLHKSARQVRSSGARYDW
jgi:tetratricopeptide (TPR) repeat protein